MSSFIRSAGFVAAASILSASAWADPFSFSTGNVTNQMAVTSRPGIASKSEREAADDFVLSQATTITGASFTGLLVSAT